MHITKTSFLSFLQCPKAFWLHRFEPQHAAPPDPATQRRLRMGQDVDRQARAAFPGGTHIPYRPNLTDQAALTTQAIADGATTLFQATFAVNKLPNKPDILTRTLDFGDLFLAYSANFRTTDQGAKSWDPEVRMAKKRRKFAQSFKFKVALEPVKEVGTVNQSAAEYQLHPN